MNPFPHAEEDSDRPRRHAPPPRPYLEDEVAIGVRFHEVDSLRIVWHGHYVTYFEEARRAFGRRYGIDYTDFIDHSVAVPVVQLHVDYLSPARLRDRLLVVTRLFQSESAKLEFQYVIRSEESGEALAKGSTLQVFTNFDGELILQWPPFMLDRYAQWESLWIQPNPPPPPPPSSPAVR